MLEVGRDIHEGSFFPYTTSSALAELILVCGPAGGITNGWRVRLMILEECHTSSGRKTKTTEREKKRRGGTARPVITHGPMKEILEGDTLLLH